MHLDRNEISAQLEIKDPFLLIDEINIDLKSNKATSLKYLTKEDWFYSCHIPSAPVMPATLQIEGMLQTLVLLIYKSTDHKLSKSFIVEAKTKFHKRVYSQPLINYFAELIFNKRGIFKGSVIGKYKKEKICEGIFTYASPDLMQLPKKTN